MLTDDRVEEWTVLVTRVLAPNSGPFTMEGTNTYVIRRPDHHQVVVVDPGPLDGMHLRRLDSFGTIELILLTHHHDDHRDAAAYLSHMTGAPIRAADASLCVGAAALSHEEVVFAGGVRMKVLSTPGHTKDSICLYLPDDREIDGSTVSGSMLTGDTILGRGSTVVGGPHGSLRDYLASLELLREYGSAIVLPGHGSSSISVGAMAEMYLAHRSARLREVCRVAGHLEEHDAPVTVRAITDTLYANVHPDVRFAAEASVRAQLDYIGDLRKAHEAERAVDAR